MSDTKDYIIDEAFKLFLTRSYEAVSISELSKAIGLTKGALYHHFLNKEELFKAVIDRHLDVIEFSNITDDMTVFELIEDIKIKAKNSLENMIGPDKSTFVPVNYISLIIDAYRHYPNFVNDKESIFSTQIKKFQKVLENGIKKGEIREDINADLMAKNLFSITAGIAASLLHNNSLDKAVKSFNGQLTEYYKLMKK